LNLDLTLVKLSLIVLAQQLVSVLKHNSQRWIIREWFTRGELPFLQWFKPSFLLSLSPLQFLGLGVIAAFTFVTFPLGIWMGSFKAGQSYAVMNIVGDIMALLTFPVTLYTMSRVLGELQMNATTWRGVALIAVGLLVHLGGCYLLHLGNNGG